MTLIFEMNISNFRMLSLEETPEKIRDAISEICSYLTDGLNRFRNTSEQLSIKLAITNYTHSFFTGNESNANSNQNSAVSLPGGEFEEDPYVYRMAVTKIGSENYGILVVREFGGCCFLVSFQIQR